MRQQRQDVSARGSFPARPLPRRIAVVGSTGAGKTTLARRLAACLGVPHMELDALYWDANWTPATTGVFRERAERALAGAAWVADGNYSKVRDIVWGRADTVVWLDYTPWVVFARLVPRTLRRGISREQLWNGNRERLWEQFFSRDSLFLWAVRTYRRRRAEYPLLFRQPQHSHLAVVHLRSPRAATAWLNSVRAAHQAAQVATDNHL